EVAALVIGFVGLIGVAAVTGLPMWKVTAFIQENIIVMETRWEGLWMNCYRQANIRMQCKVYDSLLYLPAELQASRGLMCTAVALTTIACIVSAVGMRDFYNPLLIDAQRRELGEALYIGWVTAALCFIAGVILLCRHAPRVEEKDDVDSVLYRAHSKNDLWSSLLRPKVLPSIYPKGEQAEMAGQPIELAALVLSLLGLIGVAASTGMPMWRVTAFIGENIIVMETRYEGLWMNCFRQANIRMQCKVYDSLLALTPDLQAARGLMCCSVALAAIGLFVAITGMKCTACIQDNDRAKRMVLIVAGSLIILACICSIIPVSWTGNVIIRDFYNPLLIDAQRRELGEALYIGWVSSVLLFAGGCIFACCGGSQEKRADQPR
ncbi:claudin 8, partial [Silurus meridionalis]